MDITAQLSAQHSLQNAKEIADYAMKSEANLAELMEIFSSNNYILAQRAAWSVSWIAQANPLKLNNYIEILIQFIDDESVHDAVVRNALRALEEMEIPEKWQGILMDKCFKTIENPRALAAPKAYSLTILYKLYKIYPEIKDELKLLIEEKMPHEGAAFNSRAKKIIKKLK